MKYRKRMKQLLAKGLVLIVVITGCIYHAPMAEKTSAAESQSTDWINVSGKHLELGTEGKDTFDFNITAEAPAKYDGAYWYIRKGKGTSGCVSIDHKTGVVTAKEAGTAYVCCKITLGDKLVARPEAKVTVYNKITKVKIRNLPADLSIPAGKTMDFDRTVINTSAGKKAKTNGITRWEIAEDTAGAGEASAQGQVLPIKEGAFRVRAVCFTDQVNYRLWLKDKKKNTSRITAASNWVTIKVTASDGKGYAATQEELVKLLQAPGITEITCDVSKFTDITVPDGNYKDKTIILDVPEHSSSLTAATESINSFTTASILTDPERPSNTLSMNFQPNAQLGSVLTREQSIALLLGLSGADNLESLRLEQRADVSIISSQALRQVLLVALGYQAEGSSISSNISISASIQAAARFRLLPGSAGSVFNAPQSLLQSIEVDNQSGGLANLLLDRITIPIESGSDINAEELVNRLRQYDTNSGLMEVPAIAVPVSGSAILSGQAISASVLTGAFINSAHQTVSGSLTWNQPNTIASPNQSYTWIFSPTDTTRYQKRIGLASIEIRSASQVLSEAVALVNATTFEPLSEDIKTRSDTLMAAMQAAIETVVHTASPWITVDMIYQDDGYRANLSLFGSNSAVEVTNKFFDNQDTSLTILTNGEQFVTAISGAEVTVVNGTTVSQLYSALRVQYEYSILNLQNQIPNLTDVVTNTMSIDVIAEDNVTRRFYYITLQE